MTRLIRLVPRAAAVLAILLCQAWTQSALAHAVLMDSSPKAGLMLETSPKEVSVTFNENVGPIFFKVLDRTGKEVGAPGEIKLDGFSMILPLNEELPNGTYVLTYRVISADTHPVGGTFGFSVGEPMADVSAMGQGADQGATPWTYAVAANRWVLYASMLLAAGSALFTLVLNAPASVNAAAYTLGRVGAIAAAVTYLLSIGFGGAEMVMGGAGALFAADTWARGLDSTLTPSAAIGIPAMLVLIWAFAAGPEKPKSGALAVGAAAAVASFLVTGHAATAPPVWMMAPAVGVHLVATAFWMGALYPLYKSTQLMSVDQSGALMTEFSTRAVWAVGAIVVSGVLITWTQVQSIGNLFGNDYGTSLLSKLGLFLAVLALAAYNKTALTPALERGDAAGAARIRTTIRAEYAIYILILGAAMTMTLTTPPRAIVAQGEGSGGMAMDMGGGFKTTVQSQGYTAEFDLSPAKAGENMLMVTVKDSGGNVLTGMADLELTAALESAGISDILLKGEKMPNGMWHVTIKEMIIPGEWTLRVDAFVSDFDKVGFETKVQIK